MPSKSNLIHHKIFNVYFEFQTASSNRSPQSTRIYRVAKYLITKARNFRHDNYIKTKVIAFSQPNHGIWSTEKHHTRAGILAGSTTSLPELQHLVIAPVQVPAAPNPIWVPLMCLGKEQRKAQVLRSETGMELQIPALGGPHLFCCSHLGNESAD